MSVTVSTYLPGDVKKQVFLRSLRLYIERRFGDDTPDNYGDLRKWSLLQRLQEDRIDSYSMVFVDGNFWGAGGTVKADLGGAEVLHVGWRTFLAPDPNERLGKTPHFAQSLLPQQLDRAGSLGVSAVLSFNEHRHNLYVVMQRRLRQLGVTTVCSDQPQVFNNVPQWLIICPP